MASSKKYYWKKVLPNARVKLSADPLVYLDVEDLGRFPNEGHIGYSIVDEATNKLIEPFEGEYGISKGSKEEYDSLKKNNQSSASEPLWREEIKGGKASRSKTVAEAAVAAKEPAAAAVQEQAQAEPLPEDSKPKVGKRKATADSED
jgi:hypothetical protein